MRSKKAKSLKKMKTGMKKAQVQIGETVGVIQPPEKIDGPM